MFCMENMKKFNPEDLDGKTLKIVVLQSEGITLVAGRDLDSNNLYVLSCTDKEEW